MVPVPVNIPCASLAWSLAPGTGIVPSGADVILNVLVPVANRVGGFGVLLGSLKKNAPNISPQLSYLFYTTYSCNCTTTLTYNFCTLNNVTKIFFLIC